ncbi:phenylalanine--tRNA ligase subunit beta [Planctomonas psychrotolerans]|uniref:phenylalanine--tRNA ligase subunit beta n=1 Tax=Planctomonas psychrotolerans TaxID=2528712 RepID=UPI001239BB07|nr:phenylalanine--tRNA ligase subunit beta [Planctomonas psychrotolerans]
MRIPISWLGEFVDLPENASVEHIHAALVRVGLEEEGSHAFEVTGPVVVGQVLEAVAEPQSNGKTINWCQVRVAPEGHEAADGGADVRGIVCGAHNFEVGDKVVVSLPGSVLPGPFAISARKTYGHVSDGMVASVRELGLGEEHAGILVLSTLGLDPEVGTDAIALLHLDDQAVEVNVTPDRGYAFSLRGIAREYSHSTGAAFTDPVNRVADDLAGTSPAGFPVTVADDAPIRSRSGCSVFITRTVRGVDATRATPPWMVARLKLAGVRSISLLVDITNYVMFELGQPIHGYDLDRLTGGITVRRARAGETLVTLDDATRTLDPEDLLITDESGPIGLAGVMGGAATEITSTTTAVLIEAANFDPVSIARTARRHKLPSEASKRFERGVDPAVARAAAARVVHLLVDLAGGTPDPLGSEFDESSDPAPVELPVDYVTRLIGVEFSADEVRSTLEAIGARVDGSDGAFRVAPPTWRPDLTTAADLAEEVARIVGYDRIPSVLPVAPPGRGLSREQRLRRAAADALAAAGSTEVLSYPFVSAEANDTFGAASRDDLANVSAVALANPLDVAARYLRTSMLPGLLDVARRNISRGLTDLSIFEVGLVFRAGPASSSGSIELPPGGSLPSDAELAALNAGIPAQPRHVGVVVTGNAVGKQPGQPAEPAGLADAVTAVRQLAAALAVDLRVAQGEHQALHPGRTAELFIDTPAGRIPVGFAGELLPTLAQDLDLPRGVAVAEVDLDALLEHGRRDVVVTPIVSMPAATQDLSLVVPIVIAAGDVLDTIVEGAGELLEHARLVDDYRGAGVEEGEKSLTFALRFRAPDRTLTAAEATASKSAAVALAAERFEAELRE